MLRDQKLLLLIISTLVWFVGRSVLRVVVGEVLHAFVVALVRAQHQTRAISSKRIWVSRVLRPVLRFFTGQDFV